MTNADQPEDVGIRVNEIDERLEELGDEIDLIRTVLNANRRETRTNSQTAARLNRVTTELSDIARRHQQALQIAERDAERNRQTFQAEIQRIWEYLVRQSNNGRGEG